MTTVARRPDTTRLLGAALVGAAVATALGVYGKVHDPTGKQVPHLFFSGTINMKAWLASVVLALVCIQVVLALSIYGRLPLRSPWVPTAHRTVGRLAFLVSLPVAYACLWSLGYQTYDSRTAVHSLLGCAFYGVFVTKVLVVRSSRMPAWALPVLGGALFVVVVVLWWTSSLWFFRNVGFPEV